MTRFARAKGSKASNERKEEDPTPWHEMRQQLEKKVVKNYSDCIKISCATENSPGSTTKFPQEMWFEFDEFQLKKPCSISNAKKKTSDSIKKYQDQQSILKKTNDFSAGKANKQLSKMSCKSKALLKTDKSITNNSKKLKTVIPKSLFEITTEKNKSSDTIINSKKNCNSENNSAFKTGKQNTLVKVNSMRNSTVNKISTVKGLEVQNMESLPEINPTQPKFTNQESSNLNHVHRTNLNDLSLYPSKNEVTNNLSHQKRAHNRVFKKDFDSCLSYKSSTTAQTIMANGREIEIVKYEAFWIKKEDAIKLKELKKNLKSQNMPTDKIKSIIKLERRKAEKSLSREKTNVCYHCRKFGHKFSECPDINDLGLSKAGICFKCGSTEHTHFECKVTHNQNFRYAVCFVCNEQGHIARQCSLNPQGQYPKGGSCHLCGEVTHLRKDCPKANEDKPTNLATIGNITNGIGLEDIIEVDTNDKKIKTIKNRKVQF